MKKKVLIVVAHPDDETIWMGGHLLKNRKNWDTTIISLCRRDDSDRAPKFKRVCQIYGAKSFISDLEDDELDVIRADEVISRIKEFSEQEYDYVFTHGKNGEYQHLRHLDVNKAVIKMVQNRSLSTKKLFTFSYRKKGELCYANQSSDKFIKLDESQLRLKKKIIQEVYGFHQGGFEDLCCRNTEAFKIEKIKYNNQIK